MKKFSGYEETKAYTDYTPLPTGGYIAQIMGAEEVTYEDGRTSLNISVDVLEGEYKSYYSDQYRSNTSPDRKWKGIVRINVPFDDETDMSEDERKKNEWSRRGFKTTIEAIEASNSGFVWTWDERTLKGKTVGLLVRQKEWAFNGKTGWSPECFKIVTVDSIRNNTFKAPADKPLNGNSASTAPSNTAPSMSSVSADDDLPF